MPCFLRRQGAGVGALKVALAELGYAMHDQLNKVGKCLRRVVGQPMRREVTATSVHWTGGILPWAGAHGGYC